jgi:effector-binding domain-containing protein
MRGIVRVYQDLIRWIEHSGYRRAGYSRELYHEMGADGPQVTELQIPIAK